MSCGNCHFTNLKRPGDITICDYWGCERTDPKLGKDNQGCSLMICDTAKGLTFCESVRDRMNIVLARLENIIQPNMEHPSVLHPKRLDFEKDYEKHGFKYVLKKYGTEPLWKRAYRFARKCGGKVLRMVGLKK